jgi:CoA transferase family III
VVEHWPGCTAPVYDPEGELPTGTLSYASLLAAPFGISERSSRDMVLWPSLIDPACGRRPAAPQFMGGGALHVELVPSDVSVWESLRTPDTARAQDPEALARTAQLARLPVTPYRRRAYQHRTDPAPASRDDLALISGIKIVDLTTTWAGPLTVRLLMDWGAAVVRIAPASRPDNLKYGVPDLFSWLHPDGTDSLDLDFSVASSRSRFLDLISDSDVLVQSFSRRVMPNFGLTLEVLRAANPRLLTLAMPAFPRGTAEMDWVAYGAGVHATSGLGFDSGRGYWAPVVAYPDPLAGLVGATSVAQMLRSRARTGLGACTEVTLMEAIVPLL